MLLCVRVVYQEWEQEWMIDGKSEIKSKKKKQKYEADEQIK